MSRRITQTLTIRRVTEGPDRDKYGNPIKSTSSTPWPIFAIAPGTSVETGEANRDAVTSGATIYAPLGIVPTSQDSVVLADGSLWAVVGDPAVWTGNPSSDDLTQRGVVVLIERREG